MNKTLFSAILPQVFLMVGLLISMGNSHIEEGTGNALQLFSYRMQGEKPVIDGSILSRDGDPKVKDAPDEWKEAYTREITLSDSTVVTLFIMNDEDSLYFATIARHGNQSSGTGIELYFDQGPNGGEHDNLLTGTSNSDRSDAAYIFIKGEDAPRSDLSWNGSAWIPDEDGIAGFRAEGHVYSTAIKSTHNEIAIPLKSLPGAGSNNSDLNVEVTDELGLYISMEKGGSGSGTFHWIETNGNSLDAGEGVGWADLRLNIPRSCFSFFSTVVDTVVPEINGDLNDPSWSTSYSRDIILTNFYGDTISATFKSIIAPSLGNVYVGLQVNDDEYNAANYTQVYLEEDGTDATAASRNYFLEVGFEDALRASEGSQVDIYWGSTGNKEGGWVTDTEADDNHASAATHNGSAWTYEIQMPFNDPNNSQDINMPSFGVAGLFVRYHNASAPPGQQDYYWEFTTNVDNINVDDLDDRNLSAGWSNLHLGVSSLDIVDIGPDVCASDAIELEIPVILDTTVIYVGEIDTTIVVDPPPEDTIPSDSVCDWSLSGVDLLDNNEDGIPDICQDPNGDIDGDSIINIDDNCVDVDNPDQTDSDGDGIGDLCDSDFVNGDIDNDGIPNQDDNCITVINPGQSDIDSNGIGDICDSDFPNGDVDGDSIINIEDNCIEVENPDQLDTDGDGIGDVCDNNIDQIDTCSWAMTGVDLLDNNEDGIPDVCQDPNGDVDGDSVVNIIDNCVNIDNPDQTDSDGDGIGDQCDSDFQDPNLADNDIDGIVNPDDNCVNIYNPDQLDSDGDGIGDVCDEVNVNFVAPVQAWIVDEDGDGQAETVYIEFESSLSSLPGSVTDIYWNSDFAEVRDATSEQISFVSGSDNTVIQIDLSSDPFAYGITDANQDNPPTLTLPSDDQFGGVQVVIEDRVNPIVIIATVIPPEIYLLETDSGLVPSQFPAQLIIQTSEIITPIPGSENPWANLLVVEINGEQVVLNITGEPSIDPNDSTVFTFTLADNQDLSDLYGNDISLNPDASFTDANQNQLGETQQNIEGTESNVEEFQSFVVEPLLGGDDNPDVFIPNLGTQSEINVYNEDGELVGTEPQVEIQTDYWIPPIGLSSDGSINEADAENCVANIPQTLVEYPDNCVASIMILSKTAYTADIYVTDNLGKFIHKHRQKFGHCGELDDPIRDQFPGLKTSYLVWNQREDEGNTPVASGVYVIDIHISFADGKKVHFFKRQGILRNKAPKSNCAEN